MKLKKPPYEPTACKVKSIADINLDASFFFIGKTEKELSPVCETSDAPTTTVEREDG